MILTPSAPVRITIAPTERSMLSIITTKVLPRQAVSRLAACPLKAVTSRMVAKEGVSAEKKAIRARTTNPGPDSFPECGQAHPERQPRTRLGRPVHEKLAHAATSSAIGFLDGAPSWPGIIQAASSRSVGFRWAGTSISATTPSRCKAQEVAPGHAIGVQPLEMTIDDPPVVEIRESRTVALRRRALGR
jgi:hypothetical protein